MSHKINVEWEESQQELKEEKTLYDDLCETQARIEAQDKEIIKQQELKPEEFYEVFGKKVTKKERDQMSVDMLLVQLGSTLEELERLGVDENIVSDVQINSTSYQRLNYRAGNIDSYLRSNPKY